MRALVLRLVAGPLLFAVIVALPVPGISVGAHRLLAAYAWTAAYWTPGRLLLSVGIVTCVLSPG